MKVILPLTSITVALVLSVCGISGYLLYLLYKKDDDEYETTPTTLEVQIPNEHVGSFIGRNGENIKALQQESDTRISLENHSEHSICVIRGNRDNCIHAKILIKEFIASQPVLIEDQICVHKCEIGRLIGKYGNNIREICVRSGAKIHVDNNKDAVYRIILLKGSVEQVNFAKLLIMDTVTMYHKEEDTRVLILPKPESCLQPKLSTMLNCDIPKVKRMSQLPGQTNAQFEVHISAKVNPSHFWMQIVGPKTTELDQLVEEMTEYYGKEEKRNLHILNSLEVGDVVAAKFVFDKKWYRAKVLKVINQEKDPHAELYFVDYGNTDLVSCKEAYDLRTDFLQLHFQAIECFLEGKNGKWSEEALEMFEELTRVDQWKKLLAKINCYSNREKMRAKRKSSPVPGVHVYDFNNHKDVDIA